MSSLSCSDSFFFFLTYFLYLLSIDLVVISPLIFAFLSFSSFSLASAVLHYFSLFLFIFAFSFVYLSLVSFYQSGCYFKSSLSSPFFSVSFASPVSPPSSSLRLLPPLLPPLLPLPPEHLCGHLFSRLI